ncbi:MAG: SDR family oxidoreductase [Actinobacteria bacterium]|nr:SDR family oxidoreductase [Actinomycetota bacterium]
MDAPIPTPLAGRTAVVTGASSGIGAAVARSLHDAGADVALLARREATIGALADELTAAGPARALAIPGDVTERESVLAAAARVEAELGGADVLVNGAGEAFFGPFASERAAETRQLIEVNLIGAMTATECFLDQLRDGGGDIVNLSSIGGRQARKGASVYNASKWGLNGFSEAMRQELLPDVRVLVVEPGAVDTPIVDRSSHEESKEAFRSLYGKDEMLRPEDVAEVILFALLRPPHVAINEVLLRPATQLA